MSIKKEDVLTKIEPFDYIEGRVEKFKRKGDSQAIACCPFHDDKQESFSVNSSGLWHCFGCQEKGDIFKFVELEKGYSFSESVNYLGSWLGLTDTEYKTEDWKLVATYEYPNYIKKRYELDGKKKFAFMHYEGDSLKTGRGDTEPDIYNRELAEQATTICFTEGEKCADWITSIGLTGVSLDAGAGSPIPSSIIELVKDKRVVVFPDNDKSGKEFAERLANACSVTAGIVKVVDPKDLNLGEKEDIIQWADQDEISSLTPKDIKETLITLIKNTNNYREQGSLGFKSEVVYMENGYGDRCIHYMQNGYSKVRSIGIRSLEGKYGFTSGLMTIVSGVPNNGKTALVETIYCNVAKLHGFKGVVLSAETLPPERWALNMVPKWTGKNLRRLTNEQIKTAINEIGEHFYLLNPDDNKGHKNIEWILATAKKIHESDRGPIHFIGIDPWSELDHQMGNKMETLYISWALSFIREFGRQTGIHCFVIAHPTKPNTNNMQDPKDYTKINPYMIAGSAQWYNKADFVLLVSSGVDKDGNRGDPMVSVSKVRFREHGNLGHAVLKFDHETGAFIDPPKDNSILI